MTVEERSLGSSWTAYERLSLREVVREDVLAYGGILESLSSVGFWAVFWYRISHALARHGCDPLARVIQLLSHVFLHCEISRKAIIGPRLRIFHPSSVFIGPYCRIGGSSNVGQGVFIGWEHRENDSADYPIIEDKVSVGPGATIMGPITIGTGSRIGPNAVVMQNVPARATVMAAPCRIVSRDRWPQAVNDRKRPAHAPIDGDQRPQA